jgi:ABC-type bacteriocin/lantibiotic exporter with double-glycine peptidase domain
VGLSGSGKSTLVGLLLRHYEPCSGQILIDGVPLTSLDIKWFRQQLGVVNQV